MGTWRWWAAGGALFAGLIPADGLAWQRSVADGTGVCLYWPQREISWALNEEGASGLSNDEVLEALRRSFAAWQSVDCTDLTFVERGMVADRRVGVDGDDGNLIVFRRRLCEEVVRDVDPCWDDFGCGNAYGCWGFSEGVIAVTTTSFRESTGEIVDADIEFNEARFRFTTVDGPPCREGERNGCISTDLQNTATHEIGHMLGIDHSEARDATMFASAPAGEISKRSLAGDDIAAVCGIYPVGEQATLCAENLALHSGGAGGCACGSGGTGLLPWGILASAWLTLRLRSRPAPD